MIVKIVEEAKRIMENGLLTGMTDYSHHEIYSTLWLKFALNRLEIDTSFIKIPEKFDSYARMFWMDKSEVERKTPYENKYDEWYPYLWWAVKHFENEEVDEKYLEIKYPMSWEIRASEAKYEKIAPLSEEYAKNRCGAPHSWHASEMFMYLVDRRK
jgi:Sec7-like guanine-nucleotide exchange factor